MIKGFFARLMCVFFPWAVLFTYDNPGGAFIAILMQMSLIGWIPASVWAYRVRKQALINNKKNKGK